MDERGGYRGVADVNAELPVVNDETTPLVACITIVPDKDVVQEAAGSPLVASSSTTSARASPNRLLIPFLLYCIAMGAVAVPKLNVILSLMCVQYDTDSLVEKIGNDQICNSPAVHAKMGRFMMCANIISGLGCVISSPRIGALSDKYGRKPLLAFSALGLLFGDVISVIAGWYPHSISVYWVLLEFAIGGLTGSFGATMALVQTYAADCTKQEERASVFARIHGCMYLGSAIGPAAGAIYIRTVGGGDMLSVFYIAGACHAAFITFVLLGLPESLPRAVDSTIKSAPTLESETNNASKLRGFLRSCNILHSLKVLKPERQHSTRAARRNLPLLAGIDGVAFGTQLGLASLLILYSEFKLGWKTFDASLFASLTSATRAVVLVLVLPALYHFARSRAPRSSEGRKKSSNRVEIRIIRLAILLDAASHLGFAMSSSTTLFTLSGVLAAAAAPISPTIQSLMTSYVASERTGELLGAVSSLHAIGRCLIPASMQLVYSVTVGSASGMVFFLLSLLFVVTFFSSFSLRT